jgi:hypothetical protein
MVAMLDAEKSYVLVLKLKLMGLPSVPIASSAGALPSRMLVKNCTLSAPRE